MPDALHRFWRWLLDSVRGPVIEYDEVEPPNHCPHCGLGVVKMLQTDGDGDIVQGWACWHCGNSHSSEPDRSPQEARERLWNSGQRAKELMGDTDER